MTHDGSSESRRPRSVSCGSEAAVLSARALPSVWTGVGKEGRGRRKRGRGLGRKRRWGGREAGGGEGGEVEGDGVGEEEEMGREREGG